jgi:hypothetical protein
MKNKLIRITVRLSTFLIISTSICGQSQRNPTFSCNYFGYKINPADVCRSYYGYTAPAQLEKEVNQMLKYVGLGGYQRQFYLQECPNTDNCFATIVDGKSYIFYDKAFLKEVIKNTNTEGYNWGALSILAHEIGHHVKSHVIDGLGSRQIKELEADRFSGFVMHQYGATLEEAQAAMKVYQDEQGTATHPGRAKRLKAIEEGWQEAEDLYPKFSGSPQKNNYPQNYPQPKIEEKPVIASKGCVLGDCLNGAGKFIHNTEGYYEGNWKNGKRHGEGIHYNYDGTKKYDGEWLNGKRHGYGIYYFQNGDKYEGEFYENKIKGRGKYHYANGDVYAGEFDEDKRVGGTYHFKSGGKRFKIEEIQE